MHRHTSVVTSGLRTRATVWKITPVCFQFLDKPFTGTNFAKRVFRCSAPAVWNSLPSQQLRHSETSDSAPVSQRRDVRYTLRAWLRATIRPNVTSFIKPEVHNVEQRRRRRAEPRPQGTGTQNFVRIGLAVPEICSRTDRHTHTDGQTDRHTDGRVD